MNAAIVGAIGVLLVLIGVAAMQRNRRQFAAAGAEQLKLAITENQHIPPSLHPVIDPTLCIGSFSCIKACPEGGIIGSINGVATLIEASHCVGHGRCATECPVGAIKLVFGTKERGLDLPETDSEYESTRKGVFVVGELGGMGLIKNAFRQGLAVGKTLKGRLGRTSAVSGLVDVVVVGGGPAGIAAAVSLKEQGLSARVLEQETLGGCVAHFPRGKVVMSEQVVLPFYGKFGRSLLSKEELLQDLHEVIAAAGITIEENQKVTGIDGQEGAFNVKTAAGLVVACRAVVLATGLRGSPRKLGARGEDMQKVIYRLDDPREFHDKRVLVVGGGDSAIEAAIQLAEESTAKVFVSYRQAAFARIKPRNRDKVTALVTSGRIRALMQTEVVEVQQAAVALKLPDGRVERLKNEVVIVNIGGEMPASFLKAVGVAIKKYTGQEKGTPAQGPGKLSAEARSRRRLALSLFAIGAGIIGGLMWIGQDYYSLPIEDRDQSDLHEFMKPAGLWGHGIGVIATVFMMANFIYPLRKRWKVLKGKASIRSWLTFHMFVGIMSPLVIAFHATFLAANLLAFWTWVVLAIVVGTGAFGRFMFGFFPAEAGKLLRLDDLRDKMKAIEENVVRISERSADPAAVRRAFQPQPLDQGGAFSTKLFTEPLRRLRTARQMALAEPHFPDASQFDEMRRLSKEFAKAQFQALFYATLKRLFRVWLVVHVVLATSMVFVITAHVGLSIYIGFKWIFN